MHFENQKTVSRFALYGIYYVFSIAGSESGSQRLTPNVSKYNYNSDRSLIMEAST